MYIMYLNFIYVYMISWYIEVGVENLGYYYPYLRSQSLYS